MKALTFALALIALAAVTPGMADIFTWTDGDFYDHEWDDVDNWASMTCFGPSCWPHTTDDDAEIDGTVYARTVDLVDEEIDSLSVVGTVTFGGDDTPTLTVNSIIIAGGTSSDTEVTISDATIETN
ncbi:MAG: hypothetical protein ABIG44_16865 [Planctomycetota bacterium]